MRKKRKAPSDVELTEMSSLICDQRTLNCLSRAGVKYAVDLTRKTRRELLAVRGWGRKTLQEVEAVLSELGLQLAGQRMSRDPELADLLDAAADDLKGYADDHKSVLAPDDLAAQRGRVLALREVARRFRRRSYR